MLNSQQDICLEEIMKFTQNYTVRWHDTNANRELTPSAVLTFMQETTNKHIQTMYPNLEYIRDVLHQAFILSKVYMRFYEPAHSYDEITVDTWTGIESRGFTFYRSFRVRHGKTVIADALTTWCLVDTNEHKLLPVSNFENDFVNEESLKVDMPRKIKFPIDKELEFVGNRKIVYSDIDYNKHMNNTHYPNMLVDFLPSPESYRVKELILSFIKGALYNEIISIYRVEEDGDFYFKSTNADGQTCLEAIVKTEANNLEIK